MALVRSYHRWVYVMDSASSTLQAIGRPQHIIRIFGSTSKYRGISISGPAGLRHNQGKKLNGDLAKFFKRYCMCGGIKRQFRGIWMESSRIRHSMHILKQCHLIYLFSL